ncbi:MAG: dienelactone hydrolase family protein [Clostridiales bacterium]|jgi:dienelactone hydrolase|nr:dienelactone hydrolase family protein [Clostridiales bacterium]
MGVREYKNVFGSKDYRDSPDRARYAEDLARWTEARYETARERRDGYMLNTAREERRGDFIAMHGFPLTERAEYAALPVSAETEFVGRDGDVEIVRVRLEALPGIRMFGLLFLPRGRVARRPLVFCQHGANGAPEYVGSMLADSANYNHMARRFADRGAAVFAPQLLTWLPETFGTPYDRGKLDSSLRQLGGSFTALELLLLSRCVDYFAARKDIDAERIGFCGLSWGGMYALHFGASDTRVKATYSSCFFNDRAAFNWPDWSYKGQADRFFDAEAAELIAPRYLYVECGADDPLFLLKSAEPEAARAEGYFKRAGCADRFRFRAFEGAHEFDRDDGGVEWFMEKLTGGR